MNVGWTMMGLAGGFGDGLWMADRLRYSAEKVIRRTNGEGIENL